MKPTRDWILDGLWALLTILLALVAIRNAIANSDPQSLVYFSIHLLVACLFALRRPALAQCRDPVVVATVIVSTLHVYAFDVAPRPVAPPTAPVGQALTAIGSVAVLGSTLSLGRSFGVLPADRGVRTLGLYRWVRHPMYAAYVVMNTGLCFSFPSARNALIAVAAVALFALRAHFEEATLRQGAAYRDYAERVPARILPGLF